MANHTHILETKSQIASFVIAEHASDASEIAMTDFVKPDFVIPKGLITEAFRLRMLKINDVVKDFDAVVSSMAQLKGRFPEWAGWPEGLTIEQNLIDLGWHQKEFQRRRSFAYTVVTHADDRVLGCVYVEPTRRVGYDAQVYLWARESSLGDHSDPLLEMSVKSWIESDWPFSRVAYPGRTIAWDDWAGLPVVEA